MGFIVMGRPPSSSLQQRLAFAARLEQACEDCEECPPRNHGALGWLVERLHARGVKVTAQTISKWQNGESLPTPDKIPLLAEILGVRREWLLFGAGNHAETTIDPVPVLDGAVYLVAGFIKLDGGDVELTDEFESASDIGAAINGITHKFHVTLGRISGGNAVFSFPYIDPLLNVTVVGVIREGFNVSMFHLNADDGKRAGAASVHLKIDPAKLKRIESFKNPL